MTTIYMKELSNCFKLPTRGSAEAAGYDMYSAENSVVYIGRTALIHCGFSMAMPAGWEAQVRPRSGLALKHAITVCNAPGTVDSDYRGEMGVILINHGSEPFIVNRGDRIAQLVFAQHESPEIKSVENLPVSIRGHGGYGSTGVSP